MINKLLLFFCLLTGFSFAQTASPDFVKEATSFNIVPPLSQQRHVGPDLTPKMVKNNRWLNYPTNFDTYPKGKDILAQDKMGVASTRSMQPTVNIDGAIEGVDTGAGVPDPTGAVGPNHYIHAYNSGFIIYDKSGNILMDHSSLGLLWPGQTLGDPVVIYDRYADRFVVTQFSNSPNGILFAVSQGPDPVNDGWFTYQYNLDSFPDYPHYGIWHDGYYFTANKGGNHFYAVDRDKMLVGDASAAIQAFTLPGIAANPNTVFAPLAMNSIGPNLPDTSSPGYVTYLQDDAWSGSAVDHLKVWEVNLDWANTANSVITAPIEINTTPFDSFTAAFGSGEVPQPGTGQRIDGITGVVSYNCNYYNFGTHNSVTLNFNVDVNADNSVLGIRWYELRVGDTGGAWTIEQEGTYAPDDGVYRFMGSMAMDAEGNIGLAYTAANEDIFASLRFTGRYANSPLGEMIFKEQTIVDGAGNQTNTNRYGDYAHLTLDPVDDRTFWFSSEYFSAPNEWRTRVAAFRVAPSDNIDVGTLAVISPEDGNLGTTEQITVQLINYGIDSQSNIPVWYQIDGGAMIMETFPGPLASTETALYTFATTADLSTVGQTYTIVASTNLSDDADTTNDPCSRMTTNLSPNDIGVTSINSPETGEGLTAAELVEVTIANFGSDVQSNFDVTYTLDGGTPVTEQVSGPVNPGESIDYTFTATADLSTSGIYQMSATTSLPGDFDTSNDSVTKTIFNASCIPTATTGCNVDGIKKFILGTIDVDDGSNGCNSTGTVQGYVDRTNLSTNLDRSTGNNTHILQSQHNWQGGATIEQLSVWIDFDDDGVFSPTEQLIIAENYSSAGSLNDFNLVIPEDANLGSHILRARGIDPTGNPGDPNDPCADKQFGETHDYIVNIIDTSLSIDEFGLNNSELIVNSLGDSKFEVILKSTSFTDQLVLSMHNTLGQRLVKNRVNHANGEYRYNLDLNGLSSGIYIIRLGNNSYGKVRRIILE